ncbi:glucose-6-phosphate isomerase, partial [Mesorhizobium sp. M2D.F.Ca.ET.233.01.1.1]
FAMLVFTNSLVGTGGLLLFTSVFSILSAVHYEKLNRASASSRMPIFHGGTD